MIYFDVDGVVRDLEGTFGADFQKWESFKPEYFNMMDDNPKKYLADAFPHYQVVKWINENFSHVMFMTNQKGVFERETATMQFLTKHIHIPFGVVFVKSFEEKLKWLEKNDSLLIDDYPHYDNKNVILMCRKWNSENRNGKTLLCYDNRTEQMWIKIGEQEFYYPERYINNREEFNKEMLIRGGKI